MATTGVSAILDTVYPGSGMIFDSISGLIGHADEKPSADEVKAQLTPLTPDSRLKAMYAITISKPDVWDGKDSKAARMSQYVELFGKSTQGMLLSTVQPWNDLVNKYGEAKNLLPTDGLGSTLANVTNAANVVYDTLGLPQTKNKSWIIYGLLVVVAAVVGFFGFRKKGWFRK